MSTVDSPGFSDSQPGGRLNVPASTPSRTRRVIPKPFQRGQITISGGPVGAPAVRRDWRVIPVIDVKPGDVVEGVGIINEVNETTRDDNNCLQWTVTLRGGVSHDNVRVYPGEATVYAFCPAPEEKA